MMAIVSLLTGSMGRYVLIGIAAIAALVWLHHDIVAPYKAEAARWKAQAAAAQAAAEKSAKIISDYQAQAAADREREEQNEAKLRDIANAANTDSHACRFDDTAIRRLCDLAGSHTGQCSKSMSRASGRPTS